MAQYLPIRAFNRSANVRINKVKVTPTATAYVDISDPVQRKEFAYHSSIGQVYVVGGISATNSDFIVTSGVSTDQGSSGSDLVVTTYAGVVKNRQDGSTVAVAQTDSTIATADVTNPRIDIIQVKTADGTVSKVTGTAAASPVAPAASAGNIAVAQVSVPANDTAITTNQITDVRPL